MQDMGTKRARPPEGSAAAIRAADTNQPTKHTSGRRYTAEFRERVLRLVDEARESGERGAYGALLRREGLNSPTVHRWLEQRTKVPNRPGRPAKQTAVEKELERLQRENEKLLLRLKKAEIIIDVQKKLARLLGSEVPNMEDPS